MSLFKQFKTDHEKEIQGIEITFEKNADGSTPTFIVSRMSRSNKEYAKVLEQMSRPYRRQIDMKLFTNQQSDDLMKEVFIKSVLKGWKHIFNEDGTPLVYNHENARTLFMLLPDLYDELLRQAQEMGNFRDEEKEAEAKN